MKPNKLFLTLPILVIIMITPVMATPADVRIDRLTAISPNPGHADDIISIILDIQNYGTDSVTSQKMECGIYSREVAQQQGLLSIYPEVITTCSNNAENFVQAMQFNMVGYDKATVSFNVRAPNQNSKLANGQSNWGDGHSFVVVCGLYNACGGGYQTTNGNREIGKAFQRADFTLETQYGCNNNGVCDINENVNSCYSDCAGIQKPRLTGIINGVTGGIGRIDADISISNGVLEPSMQSNYIIEMQVRPRGLSPLQFFSEQSVCDPSHPENVHREFKLNSGETANTHLTSLNLNPGDYTVWILTRTKCSSQLTQQERDNYNSLVVVQPFPDPIRRDITVTTGTSPNGGGTTGSDGNVIPSTSKCGDNICSAGENPTTCPNDCKILGPNVIAKSTSFAVDDNKIRASALLENKGTAMSDSWIMEMQPVKPGLFPQQVSTEEYSCNPNTPQNVHKAYKLGAGALESVTLESIVNDGNYDVYFLTRKGCYPQNDRVDPFPYSVKLGTVTVGSGSGFNLDTTTIIIIFTAILVIVGGIMIIKGGK